MADVAKPGGRLLRGHGRNVLLTGYWPPTNEMLRHLSRDPDLNPDGWKGEDWRGLGYDVHAYFPEFPDGSWPHGTGTFRVDYQSTSSDWWRITEALKPIAIITFSRGLDGRIWELEAFAQNRAGWIDDQEGVEQPEPSPPDDSLPPWAPRHSTLPMHAIVDAVNAIRGELGTNAGAWIDVTSGPGGYLSEYIAYHGMWYQALHARCDAASRCLVAGHIHVGANFDVDAARKAMETSLEATLRYLPERLIDCISVRELASACLDHTGALSVRDDFLEADSASGTSSLRGRMVSVLRECA